MANPNIPMRQFRDEISLSIVGFGGMVLVGMEQRDADIIVGESVDGGINYFDVAPFYGDGEAELKLGKALEPFRSRVFLACKTLRRDGRTAEEDLERSLVRLKTDHFDLYQFHAVTSVAEVDALFAPGAAASVVLKARARGRIRYIGFSAHSVEAALAMLDRHCFDSILFPVNYISYARGNFGPEVMERAREQGIARLALKAMAHGPWRKGEHKAYPKCWYRPIDDPAQARNALRFTLNEGVTALIPPGDERLFRMALSLAPTLTPMAADERESLLASAQRLRPLFRK